MDKTVRTEPPPSIRLLRPDEEAANRAHDDVTEETSGNTTPAGHGLRHRGWRAGHRGAPVVENAPLFGLPAAAGPLRHVAAPTLAASGFWRRAGGPPVRAAARVLPHLRGGRRSRAVVRRHDRAVHDPLRGGRGLLGPAVRQDVGPGDVQRRVGHGGADRGAGEAPASAGRSTRGPDGDWRR